MLRAVGSEFGAFFLLLDEALPPYLSVAGVGGRGE